MQPWRVGEIIVVSQHPEADRSDDERLDNMCVRRLKSPVRGTSIARNAGLRCAKGDIVIFVDDDVVPHPNYITLIENTLGRGVCDALITRCCYGDAWPAFNPLACWPAEKLRDAVASGSALAVNRLAFLQADIWFRENLGGGQKVISGEDNVFTLDAWRRGLRVWKSSFRSVLHPAHGSTGWRTDDVYLSSLAYVLRRHYGPPGWYLAVRAAARLSLKNRNPRASVRLLYWFLSGRAPRSLTDA